MATPDDVPAILECIRGLARYEKLEHAVVADAAKLTETLFGEVRYAEVFLAEVEEAVVGFALFFHNYSTFLAKPGIYLEDLYVTPEHRGQGIGKALFLAVVKLAHQRKCGRVDWAALDWNTPAHDFYKSLGASMNQEWVPFRLTEDHIDRLRHL